MAVILNTVESGVKHDSTNQTKKRVQVVRPCYSKKVSLSLTYETTQCFKIPEAKAIENMRNGENVGSHHFLPCLILFSKAFVLGGCLECH